MSTRYVWNRYDFTVQVKAQNRGSNQYITQQRSDIPFLVASGYNGPLFSSDFSRYFGYYTPKGTTSTISAGGIYDAAPPQNYLFTPTYISNVSEVSNKKTVTLYEAVQSPVGVEVGYWEVSKSDGRLTARCTNGFIEHWAEYEKGTTATKTAAGESGAYPSDSRYGDYWYAYLGSDSIDPTAVTYSKNNPGQGEAITVTVTPGSNTYGGTISYQYQYSVNGGSSWTNAGSKTTAANKSITVPANAAQFQVRVVASDNMGFTSTTYVYGDNLTVTPGNRAPSAPASVTAAETAQNTFTVRWTASTDPDGNLAGYQVERSYNGSTWSSVTSSTTATSLTDTVAAGTTSVIYRVRAFDTEGLYSSWTTSAASTPNRPPTAPGSITVSESSPQNFSVSWTASTDPDGNLAGYKVERSLNGGSAWSTVTNSTSKTSLTDKVAAGTASVIYRVRAFDTDGLYSGWTTSEPSAVSNAPTVPAAITLPPLINVGESFSVTWAASSDPDGNLTGYQVERSYNRGNTWTSVAELTAETSFSDIAPEGNATVMFRVRAVDATGLQSAWKTSVASTINTAPEAPASVAVPDVIQVGQSFTLRWAAAADAEDNVTGYEVERSYDDGTTWSSVSSPVSGTSAVITENTGNAAVSYRVRAVDAGGLYSGWTAARSCPINQPPSAPPEVILGTVRLGEYMTVVWTAAADPDGTVESYTLQRSVDGGSYETVYSGPSLTYTDRSDNRAWDNVQYRVRAVDDRGGQSGWTESAVRQIEPGQLYLTGPEADLGRVIRSFDFTVTVQASGEFPVDGIQVVITLDGEERLRRTVSSGEDASIRIDLWVTESGEHTIHVTATKERYTQADGTYRFIVVPIELGSGGRLERLENRKGQAVYPVTLMEGIFRRKDGKSLEEILDADGSGGGGTEPIQAAFYIDPATGLLHMAADSSYTGPEFRLVNGNLEVVYGGK